MSTQRILWFVLGLMILVTLGEILVYLVVVSKNPPPRINPSPSISATPSLKETLVVQKVTPVPKTENASPEAQNLTRITLRSAQGDSRGEITAGKNCIGLLRKVASLQQNISESSRSANLIYDVSGDGKVDYLDLTEVMRKITANTGGEEWCGQILRGKSP